MAHFLFDTETSGFLTPNYPENHPKQGRILQIAALLLDDKFEEVANFYTLIDIPDHVEVHPGAFAAHGITKERCKTYGMPIEAAIIVLDSFACKASAAVGHNIQFDSNMIASEETRIFGAPKLKLQNAICTMLATTPICQLPGTRSKYKWPKLSEAYQFIFKETLEGAHDSLADIRATARIYKWLSENNHLVSKSNGHEPVLSIVRK